MTEPQVGYFRLYPHFNLTMTAGEYVLDASIDMTVPTATMEPLHAAVDVIAPRYRLPPDQVLSTFPPAGSRGSYGARLPQIVIRRRTLPWERNPGRRAGDPDPVPWLALVLISAGEGTIVTNKPVAECITPGVTISDPTVTDAAMGDYLEVPRSVVKKLFPTVDELALLAHVRQVNLDDTELAMGDDDGWMSVVVGNRLPLAQTEAGGAGVSYTVALVNLEGQLGILPKPSDHDPDDELKLYAPLFDIGAYASVLTAQPLSADAAAAGAAAAAASTSRSASYASALAGTAWAAGTAKDAAATVRVKADEPVPDAHRQLLGIIDIPYALLEPTYRFPVLTSWSFTSEGDTTFETLANEVSSRLLGYVAHGPELPDGGVDPSPPAPTNAVTEPPSRPLPLVTATGHVVTAYRTRIGEALEAYFRGALMPTPSVRDGDDVDPAHPPLAHAADQLRRVTPDGLQDLTYAAAFEIGRLLALSRPGVVAQLNRWRRERFADAAHAAVTGAIGGRLTGTLKGVFDLPDPLAAVALHPPTAPEPVSGRQMVRGLLSVIADAAGAVASPRPPAPAGHAVDDVQVLAHARGTRLAAGLALPAGVDLAADLQTVAATLRAAPVTTAAASGDLTLARAALEEAAAALVDAASALDAGDIAAADIIRRLS
ncbi:hypothetical protein [Microbacterium sp. KR10-403]|uniref:hypothetical protein n=1 Tax=Microbacterium sp. KR10-403 TaxID=3158581 RepID=UPI0032E3950F